MTRITSEQVRHVAKLARLEVTDEEVETFTSQLEGLLEHFSAISAIDTTQVQPTARPIETVNVLRSDYVKPSLTQEEVLSNAPASQDGRFIVPQILESE
ncbi:MAG: Asp-tRNA(Asn)/Glu-tRNA(Gln) amidotransferase subunit GatC [Acidimicrobiia bacterium]